MDNIREKATVLEVQQIFCNNFGYNDKIIWDCYYANQKQALCEKINSIFGVTELKPNGRLFLNKNLDVLDIEEKKNNKLREKVNLIIEAIWNQRKYNGNILLMATIFVTCIDYTKITEQTLEKCCASTDYSIHPVFRIRKCIKNNDSTNCCMIFVDEHARVYQNWDEFKNNNSLPKSYVFSPKNGIYNNDDNNDVMLEIFLPPSAQSLAILTNAANVTASVGQIGAGVVLIATLPFTAPVAASAATCAGFVSLVCGAYKAGQGLNTLYDMTKHEESIGVQNSKARNAIFDVAGGITSIASSGATKLLESTTRTGSAMETGGKAAANIINGVTFLMNEFGTNNKIFEFIFTYSNNASVSMLKDVQIVSALNFLTHSTLSLQSASTIISNYHQKTIKDLRTYLSQNNKKIFGKMQRESIRVSSANSTNGDLIRTLRNIPDKEQFFRHVYKINKSSNKNNVRALCQKINTNTAIQVIRGEPDVPVNRELTLYVKATTTNLIEVCASFDMNDLKNCIINIAESLTIDACNLFFNFVEEFLRTEKSSIEKLLLRFIPLENYLSDIFYVLNSLTGDNYISDFILNNIKKRSWLYKAIHDFYESFRTKSELSKQCQVCNGNYYV